MCLCTRDLETLPVILSNSSRKIVVFVKDDASTSSILRVMKRSSNIKRLSDSTNLLALLQYSAPSNTTSDLFEEVRIQSTVCTGNAFSELRIYCQDVRNSFSIASVLLDRLESTTDSPADMSHHNELAVVFRDFRHIANIVPVAPGNFVQLRSWKISLLRHLDTNETEIADSLSVTVIPNTEPVPDFSPNRLPANVSTLTSPNLPVNTTTSEGWLLGYHFRDSFINDSAGIFLDSDEDIATTPSEVLTIYLPIAIGAILALVLLAAVALYSWYEEQEENLIYQI